MFSFLISTAPDDACPCGCGSVLRSNETFQLLIFCTAHTKTRSLPSDKAPESICCVAEQASGMTWEMFFLPSLCFPGLHLLWQRKSEGCGIVLQITTLQWKYSYKVKIFVVCTGSLIWQILDTCTDSKWDEMNDESLVSIYYSYSVKS